MYIYTHLQILSLTFTIITSNLKKGEKKNIYIIFCTKKQEKEITKSLLRFLTLCVLKKKKNEREEMGSSF